MNGSGCGDMFFRICQQDLFAYVDILAQSEVEGEPNIPEDGGRYWTRTSDPYRVKVVL